MSEEIDHHISVKYDIRKRLGKGAYGIVWKAEDRYNGQTVALKKIFDAFRNKTDAQRTFREVMLLQEFHRHPNIVRLMNLLRANNDRDIYLVFEYMDTDLHNVIRKGNILKEIHKQYIMYQLFCAVKYLHSGHVIHRDLKPSNVLLDVNCTMKLADFGLARSLSQVYSASSQDMSELPELTEYVATRWYRAPEILLSAKRYTKGVDLWSLGCILGEMQLGHALFPGTSTMNQIERIMRVIPSPTKLDIDRAGSVYAESVLGKIPMSLEGTIKDLLKGAPIQAIDLVEKLLVFNPDKRLTIDTSLRHTYVQQFRNPGSELILTHDVTLAFPDDVQLDISEYRNKLYEMMPLNKLHIRSLPVEYQMNGQVNNNDTQAVMAPQPYDRPRRGSEDSHSHRRNTGGHQEFTRSKGDRPSPSGKKSSDPASAPLAQAEVSDTDLETNRSRNGGCIRSNSDHKRKAHRSSSGARRSSYDKQIATVPTAYEINGTTTAVVVGPQFFNGRNTPHQNSAAAVIRESDKMVYVRAHSLHSEEPKDHSAHGNSKRSWSLHKDRSSNSDVRDNRELKTVATFSSHTKLATTNPFGNSSQPQHKVRFLRRYTKGNKGAECVPEP